MMPSPIPNLYIYQLALRSLASGRMGVYQTLSPYTTASYRKSLSGAHFQVDDWLHVGLPTSSGATY